MRAEKTDEFAACPKPDVRNIVVASVTTVGSSASVPDLSTPGRSTKPPFRAFTIGGGDGAASPPVAGAVIPSLFAS